MMLFDDIERDELRSGTPFVSLFRDVNQYDWPGADHVRNTIESWFKKYPLEHQNELRNRFRDDNDSNHEGAFFELFLHELLARLGFSLTVHPEIPGTGKHPDFLACRDAQRLYFEATVTGKESGPYTRNRDEQDVLNKLNTLTSPNFRITIHIEGELKRTLSTNEIVRPFRELLDGHNPDEVQCLIDEQGRNVAPSERIEHGDWSLEGWLSPIAPDKRKRDPTRPLIIGYHRGEFTDCVTPVQDALREKKKKARNLDAPFVIAVNTRDRFYHDREHDMEVLFGKEQLLYSKQHPDLPPEVGRNSNGVWSRNSRIDAFLSCQRIDLWNLWHSASVCLYINPHKTNMTLPDALFRLPHAKGCNGKMQWLEGENIGEILGISNFR